MMMYAELIGNYKKSEIKSSGDNKLKKKKDIIDEYGEYFINGSVEKNIKGCVANGIPKQTAEKVWRDMETFAQYAFNKSHAVVYSALSIRTAWLYKYYPYEYLTAVLNNNLGNNKRLPRYLSVVRSNNIPILAPDINYSGQDFTTDGKAIRVGLSGLKSVGKSSKAVLEERDAHGLFKGLEEFLYRMAKYKEINKSIIDAFIKVGMFDDYKGSRKDKLEQVEKFLSFRDTVKSLNKDYSIFDAYDSIKNTNGSEWNSLSINIEESGEEYNNLDRLLLEKEVAGMYISGSPTDEFKKELTKHKVTSIGEVLAFFGDEDEEEVSDDSEGITIVNRNDKSKRCQIAGVITDKETRFSKNNKPFITFNLEDGSGVIKVVYFPKDGQPIPEYLEDKKAVIIYGNVSKDDFGISTMVNELIPLVNVEGIKDAIIKVSTKKEAQEIAEQLNTIKDQLSSGKSDVILKGVKNELTVLKNVNLYIPSNIRLIKDTTGKIMTYRLKAE